MTLRHDVLAFLLNSSGNEFPNRSFHRQVELEWRPSIFLVSSSGRQLALPLQDLKRKRVSESVFPPSRSSLSGAFRFSLVSSYAGQTAPKLQKLIRKQFSESFLPAPVSVYSGLLRFSLVHGFLFKANYICICTYDD